jgi:uracil-DNA glycosylase
VEVDLLARLPDGWRAAMEPYLDRGVVARLAAFLAEEYRTREVYPALPDLFRAFHLCPFERTRVVILGQDPYHRPGQAHGLAFSVPPGVPLPPSLRTVFAELSADLGVDPPASGDLSGWAVQGVLLLNTVLTVRAGQPGSHAGQGWEHLTDAAVRALNARPERVVFLLWGVAARRRAALVTRAPHAVLPAGHPSPMSARWFRGARPFSSANALLAAAGRDPVRWV